MTTNCVAILLAATLALPSFVEASNVTIAPVPAAVTEHSAADGTTYYSVALLLPNNLTFVTHAWLEFRADVSAKDLNGFVDPAPTLEVYALKQTLSGDPEPSKFEVMRQPMTRPVAIGSDRLIKIDITEFVQKILTDPSKNHGIVLGPLTRDKRGIFDIKQDGLSPGVTAHVRILE